MYIAIYSSLHFQLPDSAFCITRSFMHHNLKYTISLCLIVLIHLNQAFAQWSVSAEKDDSVCIASELQYDLHMISDNKGGAFIAWHDYRSTMYPEIYAQWIDKNGIPRWATNGIKINPFPNPSFNQFELINDSAGGIIVTYEEYGINHYVERIDSNGILLWKLNLDVLLGTSSANYAADGNGGVYVLFNNDSQGKAYFTHFNSNGTNVTPNGKKEIVDVFGMYSAGKIMVYDSTSLIIVSSADNLTELICLTDTGGNIISSTTTTLTSNVNILQKGVNNCAILVTSSYSESPNLRVYRINVGAELSVSLIGQDITSCDYYENGFAEIFGFLESDTNNLYLAYTFSCNSGISTMRFNEAGTNFKIIPLHSYYTQCSDGAGGFYSALSNKIYHFKSTDSLNYSDTITYSNLGFIMGNPKIIPDGSNGCLISFAKVPNCDINANENGVYCKRYPENGIQETSLPYINCLFASGVCFSGNMSLKAGCPSNDVEFYWYNNGQLIDSSTDNNFHFILTDYDSVEYFQCIAKNILGSDTSEILAYKMYTLPLITYLNDTLSAYIGDDVSYQWYHNNSSVGLYNPAYAIAGATHSYFVPNSSDYYGCRVFAPNGCYGYALPLLVSSVSITTLSKDKNIRIYPIPTEGILTIQLPVEKGIFELIASSGKILLKEAIKTKTFSIDLTDFPDGMYFVRITFQHSSEIIKVEKKK